LSIAGVTGDMLAMIRAARPNRPVAVPIGVMAQLVASGVKPAEASATVARLSQRATDAQLVALGSDVNSDVSRGTRATSSLEVRIMKLTPMLARGGAPAAAPGITSAAKPPNP
jgi:hypothetical protein